MVDLKKLQADAEAAQQAFEKAKKSEIENRLKALDDLNVGINDILDALKITESDIQTYSESKGWNIAKTSASKNVNPRKPKSVTLDQFALNDQGTEIALHSSSRGKKAAWIVDAKQADIERFIQNAKNNSAKVKELLKGKKAQYVLIE